MSIKSALIDKLIEIHGGTSRPGIAEVRSVCTELQFRYPAMFKDDDEKGGYGLGGTQGEDGFASQVLDSLRKKDTIGKTVKRAAEDDDSEIPVAKKSAGKPKMIYGVIREKFSGDKINKDAATLFSQTNNEAVGFEDREKIYQENRPDLQAEFAVSKKAIGNVCRGFWKDWRHVANHFTYLTGTPDDLSKAIEENFPKQMQHLELYISHVRQDAEYAKLMQDVDQKCELEFDGSTLYKHIIITRLVADKLDKSGATLVRLESDGPAALTASPHLLAVCVDKTWVFEVFVDKTKVLGNLSFPQAIASFLHVAFVFNLEYPKESQTMADIWQRKFARYGTNTGTRTPGKLQTAQNKMKKYLLVLGELLA